MGTRLIEPSQRALTEKVNKGEEEIFQALHCLAEELGTYGFQGTITGELKVAVLDKVLGGEQGSVTRSFSLPFRR